MIDALYYNGLERTKVGVPEKALKHYLKGRGINLEHGAVDWHSGRAFTDLLNIQTKKAQQKLRQNGRLLIVGASAGGSLGVNVFQRVRAEGQDLDVSLVALSAWLQVFDREQLDYVAFHRTDKKPSEAFRDSVLYCSETASGQLTDDDKARMLTTYPRADGTVPTPAMGIEGVESRLVGGRSHIAGIVRGAVLLPSFVKD